MEPLFLSYLMNADYRKHDRNEIYGLSDPELGLAETATMTLELGRATALEKNHDQLDSDSIKK